MRRNDLYFCVLSAACLASAASGQTSRFAADWPATMPADALRLVLRDEKTSTPVPNVLVEFRRKRSGPSLSGEPSVTIELKATKKTDADGKAAFALYGDTEGYSLRIEVVVDGRSEQTWDRDLRPEEIVAGQVVWTVPWTQAQRKLKVKVVDKATSQPVKDASLHMVRDGRSGEYAWTGPDGMATFIYPGAGKNIYVSCLQIGRLSLARGQTAATAEKDWENGFLTMPIALPKVGAIVTVEVPELLKKDGARVFLICNPTDISEPEMREVKEGKAEFIGLEKGRKYRVRLDAPDGYMLKTSPEMFEYDGQTPAKVKGTVVAKKAAGGATSRP